MQGRLTIERDALPSVVVTPQFPDLRHRIIGHIEQAETNVHNIELSEHH